MVDDKQVCGGVYLMVGGCGVFKQYRDNGTMHQGKNKTKQNISVNGGEHKKKETISVTAAETWKQHEQNKTLIVTGVGDGTKLMDRCSVQVSRANHTINKVQLYLYVSR